MEHAFFRGKEWERQQRAGPGGQGGEVLAKARAAGVGEEQRRPGPPRAQNAPARGAEDSARGSEGSPVALLLQSPDYARVGGRADGQIPGKAGVEVETEVDSENRKIVQWLSRCLPPCLVVAVVRVGQCNPLLLWPPLRRFALVSAVSCGHPN